MTKPLGVAKTKPAYLALGCVTPLTAKGGLRPYGKTAQGATRYSPNVSNRTHNTDDQDPYTQGAGTRKMRQPTTERTGGGLHAQLSVRTEWEHAAPTVVCAQEIIPS